MDSTRARTTTSSSRSPTRSWRRGFERSRGGPPGPSAAGASRPVPIVLDEADRAVTVGGEPVRLSAREFALLECFLRQPGRLLTRDHLLDAAWPFGVALTPNAVEAYVHRLRDKLGEAGGLIQTERGSGYRLVRE